MSDEIMEDVADTEQATETQAQDGKVFTQEELDRILADRLQRQKRQYEKQFEGIDPKEARQIMLEREQAEVERQKDRGEFDKVLKETVEKKDLEISQYKQRLESTLIDGALLEAASKHSAVEPSQVSKLLRDRVRLASDGSVEVVDENGSIRYNDKADPLSVNELMGDFLTANPHFVKATQGGAGTQGMAGGSTQKPISVADMVANWKDGGAEAFRAYKKANK